MINLKEKSWILIAIAGILVIISIVIPFAILMDFETMDGEIWWIFGGHFDISNGELSEILFYEVQNGAYIAVGSAYFVIILIIGIFLVLSAILTMKGKEIPHLGLIWLILGIFLVLSPLLIRGSFQIIEPYDIGLEFLFAYQFNSILLLMPIAGTVMTVPEILNKTGERKNG